jgi:hypothetical protein
MVPTTMSNQLNGKTTQATPKIAINSGDMRTAHSASNTPAKPGMNKTTDHQSRRPLDAFGCFMNPIDETKILFPPL